MNSAVQTIEKDITNPNTRIVVTHDNNDIPEEEILKRLPVKSLLRFKSVSKVETMEIYDRI